MNGSQQVYLLTPADKFIVHKSHLSQFPVIASPLTDVPGGCLGLIPAMFMVAP